MRTSVLKFSFLALLGAGPALAGISGVGKSASVSGCEPVISGPVESINSQERVATVLNQAVVLPAGSEWAVGDAVTVCGKSEATGRVLASHVAVHGLYTPGSTPVLLVGRVDSVNGSVGRAVVGGVTVDFTETLATSSAPSVGSIVRISGTQPLSRGAVLANGISGVGANGISGVGRNGISGVGANGISGVGRNGISGVGANGISGVGRNGISGVGANGISGVGRNGISGVG